MAICTGLIPAMEIDNIHDITVITNSIAIARKILEFKVNPLQNMFVRGPLTHDPRVPPVASQHNFIMQPLITKEWNARIF